jgi:anti-sigma B factor antagonist
MDLQIDTLPDGISRLRLIGKLDMAGVDRVEIRFATAATGARAGVVVDLAGLDFIGSMGIRMILSTARAVKGRGQRLALYAPQPLVRELLDRVSLGDLVPIAADEAGAIAAVRG